jgi:3-oxoacyl-[acyl-carrier-protein] synthase II
MKVVVTGTGSYSSLGHSCQQLFENLEKGQTGIRAYPEWSEYKGLNSLLGAPVPEFDSKTIPRNVRRSMSRMSEMAYLATVDALEKSGIKIENLNQDRTLICMGSTTGSPIALMAYYKKYIETHGPQGQLATSFFKVMNHSVPANVALGLGFKGPMLSPSSACSTSSQAIILGIELIKAGLYDVVIAGGADELDHTSSSIFDIALAASTKFNDRPLQASRPFDKDRDGLVVSEGAGVVILESETFAKNRGVKVLAELKGGAYHCDGTHMTQPQVPAMIHTMKKALDSAKVDATEIKYINAHATGTRIGDLEEAKAIGELFGNRAPVSSLKGHMGHSLAACGALEVNACIQMMKNGKLIATRNLEVADPDCGPILLPKENLDGNFDCVLSNNFAFGGMNTSIVISRYEN